jgi:hypothetical protein
VKRHDVFQPKLQDISDHPASSSFSKNPNRKLVGRSIHMVDPDAGKALFKHRENLLGIDLSDRTITV